MGDRSGPAQGQGLEPGHHAGFADRYKDAGKLRVPEAKPIEAQVA